MFANYMCFVLLVHLSLQIFSTLKRKVLIYLLCLLVNVVVVEATKCLLRASVVLGSSSQLPRFQRDLRNTQLSHGGPYLLRIQLST